MELRQTSVLTSFSMAFSPMAISQAAADKKANTSELKQYWAPARCVDLLIWLCDQHLVPYRRVQRPPDFTWSQHQLMCRFPWVTAPTLSDMNPIVGSNMILLSIMDAGAGRMFQGFYVSDQSNLNSDMIAAAFDHFVMSSGLPAPQDDKSRMIESMALLEDWLLTFKKKKKSG